MALVAVKNPDDALDIVQDVMLALAKKYAGKPVHQWPPLFYRMLGNRIKDFHRSGSLRRRLFGWWESDDDDPNHTIEQTPSPNHHDPEHWYSIDSATAELQHALSSLPGRQQQAFMLRAWEGLDVKATAAAMGCSTGSVKTHYSRAVRALRSNLQDHYDV